MGEENEKRKIRSVEKEGGRRREDGEIGGIMEEQERKKKGEEGKRSLKTLKKKGMSKICRTRKERIIE